jgi:xanthine dehydrogenase YagR molybdenum-binding subunit
MASRKIVKSKHFFEENFVESLAEVPVEKHEPWTDKTVFKYIGKPVSRLDGYDKVSGTAVYSFDVILPRMAFARTLRCPLAHARIKSINIDKALKIDGVYDVIT